MSYRYMLILQYDPVIWQSSSKFSLLSPPRSHRRAKLKVNQQLPDQTPLLIYFFCRAREVKASCRFLTVKLQAQPPVPWQGPQLPSHHTPSLKSIHTALLDDCFTPPPPPHSQLTTSSDFAKKIEALGTGVVLVLLLPTHPHLCPSALPCLPRRQHPPLSHGRAAPFLVSFPFLFFFLLFLVRVLHSPG